MAMSLCNPIGVRDKSLACREKTKPVLKLLLCISAILVFMFWLGPMFIQLPMLHPVAEYIEENDINANMYFYTEVEEFSEAHLNMENTRAFPPGSMREP
ncbi:MAG: hypothetical protein JRE88_00800 [Deltaproteobacteria bacterium]|jgi:hypothetical protein|nr:hypothetical protein [Deltaproteobacteria bacterium]